MGRPRISDEPRITTAVRIPASLREQLRAAARERDVSVNHLVTRAVADYLRRLPPVDVDLTADDATAGAGAGAGAGSAR